MPKLYLARSGHPFRDRDAAEVKAFTMSEETGLSFEIVPHLDGWAVAHAGQGGGTFPGHDEAALGDGVYAVAPSPHEEALSPPAPRVPSVPPQPVGQSAAWLAGRPPRPEAATTDEAGREDLTFRPSPRAFIHYFIFAACGGWLILYAGWVIQWLQVETGLRFTVEDAAYLITILSASGMLIGVYFLTAFVWIYISHIYRVKEDLIVQEVGVIARKTSEVHPADVRNISVDQTLIQRLLGVGDVHFATAGTADYDLIMKNIAGPAWVRDQIYQRVHASMRDRRRD